MRAATTVVQSHRQLLPWCRYCYNALTPPCNRYAAAAVFSRSSRDVQKKKRKFVKTTPNNVISSSGTHYDSHPARVFFASPPRRFRSTPSVPFDSVSGTDGSFSPSIRSFRSTTYYYSAICIDRICRTGSRVDYGYCISVFGVLDFVFAYFSDTCVF